MALIDKINPAWRENCLGGGKMKSASDLFNQLSYAEAQRFARTLKKLLPPKWLTDIDPCADGGLGNTLVVIEDRGTRQFKYPLFDRGHIDPKADRVNEVAALTMDMLLVVKANIEGS